MKSKVSKIKNGRAESIEVKILIHAPPMPSDNSSKGPTQQTEAAMAASAALIPNQGSFLGEGVSCSVVIKNIPQ
jgi:hypothetical protein